MTAYRAKRSAMLFNSFSFCVFLAVVLLVTRAIPGWGARKFALLVSSYLFYAAWNPPFVLLLWLSTSVDWILANQIANADRPSRRKTLLLLSLAANLGLLGYFKYGGFLLENLEALLGAFGGDWSSPAASIILPVGISFYTFQTLSFTIDVYRGKMRPGKSFLDYALYVSFFPQLVAGPIVRAADFLPQCDAPRRASGRQMSWGLVLIVFGLFSKTVIADNLVSGSADRLFGGSYRPGFSDAWFGTIAFAIQIFGDFAGYSTCAIGVALCLGFALPDNFRMPYAAVGFSDFWRRWHISLSTWLRDYLYVPMGGNRLGRTRTLRNLSVTMLLGGLWHGASWNFVLWGGLHGFYLIVERVLRARLGNWSGWSSPLARTCLGALTFLGVCVAWVFFRAPSLDRAREVLAGMLGLYGIGNGVPIEVLVTASVVVAFQCRFRNESLETVFSRTPSWLRHLLVGAMLAAVIVAIAGGSDSAFIYFQF